MEWVAGVGFAEVRHGERGQALQMHSVLGVFDHHHWSRARDQQIGDVPQEQQSAKTIVASVSNPAYPVYRTDHFVTETEHEGGWIPSEADHSRSILCNEYYFQLSQDDVLLNIGIAIIS